MIVVTGAAGFIGSCLVGRLNSLGYLDIVLVDEFSDEQKNLNLAGKKYSSRVDRKKFKTWLEENHKLVQFIFHIGARTDTTEFNGQIFDELNVSYSKMVWQSCVKFGLPLVYASSAATYGDGSKGYDDNHALIPSLKPLNPYGDSKNEFDNWVLNEERQPYFWAGLKFFNVYGPNEYHKGRMASVIFHAFNQIKQNGGVKLFRSHRPDFEDGKQLRDFIYVMDVVDVCIFLMTHRKNSAIYNLGTGTARTFLDLATATFNALHIPVNIEYIDIPADIRDKYQYFTEARMEKLRNAGYGKPFTSLEKGVTDYVSNYLKEDKYF
jgi:ADP-L-glycero-D-manno-heptose 6-epimerase